LPPQLLNDLKFKFPHTSYQDLEINGLGIAREHATITAGLTEGSRFLTALIGGVTYHNGNQIKDGTTINLEHRDRVVLGACTMVFVMVDPTLVLDRLVDEICSYSDALEELFAGKVTRYAEWNELLPLNICTII
jgi:hypothetical protein